MGEEGQKERERVKRVGGEGKREGRERQEGGEEQEKGKGGAKREGGGANERGGGEMIGNVMCSRCFIQGFCGRVGGNVFGIAITHTPVYAKQFVFKACSY